MEQMYEHDPIRVAHQIIDDLLTLRGRIRTTAEGFAVLDFVQGHVATELPTDTARDIIDVLRDQAPAPGRAHLNDLILFWLESYRRAYSQMIMRVLENDSDPMAA